MEPSEPAILVATIGVVAAVVSALSAVESHRAAGRIYLLQPKRDVLRRLAGSLHVLNLMKSGQVKPEGEPLLALNEATAVFAKDSEVTDILKELKSGADYSKLMAPLVRAMATASELNLDLFENEFLLRPFSITPHQQQ